VIAGSFLLTLNRFLILSSMMVALDILGAHSELGIFEILTCSICLCCDDLILVLCLGLERSTISVINTTDFFTNSRYLMLIDPLIGRQH
jgi:hypothetical protein